MAIGDIQHSQLPDNLLHEPKGASTAAAGTTYLADGNGSGAFGKVPVSSLDIAVPSVADLVPTTITPTTTLNGSGLTVPADGTLTDVAASASVPVAYTITINKNASETLRLFNNQAQINSNVVSAINNLETKLNAVISALKGLGLLDD
jgi:hypothetical protein